MEKDLREVISYLLILNSPPQFLSLYLLMKLIFSIFRLTIKFD